MVSKINNKSCRMTSSFKPRHNRYKVEIMHLVKEPISDTCDRFEIKKHSATVQIGNKIAAQQRKIYNALLYIGRDSLNHDQSSELFYIGQAELKRLSGDASTNNKQLQENLKGLMSTIVEFNVLQTNNRTKWHATTLLSEVTIEEGKVYFGFAPTIRKTLLHPEYYVLLDLNIIKGLNSKYAIALYENARDYLEIGFPKMTLDIFRKLMGVEEGKYKNFADLKKRVIDPSIEEISEKTDIFIDYELFKEGRRFKYIQFYIYTQNVPIDKEMLDTELL
jgi:plasmid replication initiation protein